MKKATFLLVCLVFAALTSKAQNADNLYFNSQLSNYDYQSASFVIDTALPAYPFRRAMLLWSTNTGPNAATQRALSLDETLDNGQPTVQRRNPQPNTFFRNLQPKKIIRSRFTKHYYLLAYVINSTRLINNIAVASSAFVLKLDDNLNLVWSSKIHFNAVTDNNAGALIEYNDIIETANANVVIVGRTARTQTDRQALLLTRLNQVNGNIIWAFRYSLWSCHANGLSVAETSNGELAVTGYAEQCVPPSFVGNRQLLYARTSGAGAPIQFSKFLNPRPFSGDKITRFISVAGADRFFITGFVDILNTATGVVNKQNLVVDISQNGTLNRAAHFGESPLNEEVNDHIFSRLVTVPNTFELYLTGYTNSYTANNSSEAYFNVLRYNSANLTFVITRYDVLRNNYPGNVNFLTRRGIEVKNAGPRRFAILTNATFQTQNPVYNHAYTTVFVRDLAATATDTVCYRPKTPPLVNFFPQPLDTVAIRDSNFARYTEPWIDSPRIQFKTVCGTIWKIFPGQAVLAIVVPPDQIAPDETATLAKQASFSAAPDGQLLFPNPAGSEVTVALDKQFAQLPKPITLRLLSPEMRQISTETFSYQPRHTVGLKGLSPGVYFIELIQGKIKKLLRFVKE